MGFARIHQIILTISLALLESACGVSETSDTDQADQAIDGDPGSASDRTRAARLKEVKAALYGEFRSEAIDSILERTLVEGDSTRLLLTCPALGQLPAESRLFTWEILRGGRLRTALLEAGLSDQLGLVQHPSTAYATGGSKRWDVTFFARNASPRPISTSSELIPLCVRGEMTLETLMVCREVAEGTGPSREQCEVAKSTD